MTNQESVNQFLTEKFLGKCWHKPELIGYTDLMEFEIYTCSICGERTSKNKDLFTPNGFFSLKDKLISEGHWEKFKVRYGCWSSDAYMWVLPDERIDYRVFPNLVAEYLGWKEGE